MSAEPDTKDTVQTDTVQVDNKKDTTVQVDNKKDTTVQVDKKKKSTSVLTYVYIGVAIVVVLLLAYYAYNKFCSNKSEPTKSTKSTKSLINNYDLSSAIKKLNRIQNQVLKRLSRDVGI